MIQMSIAQNNGWVKVTKHERILRLLRYTTTMSIEYGSTSRISPGQQYRFLFKLTFNII